MFRFFFKIYGFIMFIQQNFGTYFALLKQRLLVVRDFHKWPCTLISFWHLTLLWLKVFLMFSVWVAILKKQANKKDSIAIKIERT